MPGYEVLLMESCRKKQQCETLRLDKKMKTKDGKV